VNMMIIVDLDLNVCMRVLISLSQKTDSVFLNMNKICEMQTTKC